MKLPLAHRVLRAPRRSLASDSYLVQVPQQIGRVLINSISAGTLELFLAIAT